MKGNIRLFSTGNDVNNQNFSQVFYPKFNKVLIKSDEDLTNILISLKKSGYIIYSVLSEMTFNNGKKQMFTSNYLILKDLIKLNEQIKYLIECMEYY